MLVRGTGSYGFGFQLLLEQHFALVQPAEAVDFVLVFSSDFGLVGADGGFIFLR